MRYVKLTDGVPAPYTLNDLRRDENLSIRDDPDPATLAQYGVYPVTVASQPTLAPGQTARTKALPELVGNAWVLGWDVDPVTPEMVKAEAHRRIIAVLPEWKQRNLTAQATILAEKGRTNWTAEEAAAWAAGEALWAQIAAIRAASDTLEAMDPMPDDIHAWEGWP